MNLIKLPTRFFDDHRERDLETPKVVKSTKRHYFIADDDPAIPELLDDAEYYAADICTADFPELFGLVSSARATVKALKK